jgi:hypothetical protein
MQNYHVDIPAAMSEGKHMINPTKDDHMPKYLIEIDFDDNVTTHEVEATCLEGAEYWASDTLRNIVRSKTSYSINEINSTKEKT